MRLFAALPLLLASVFPLAAQVRVCDSTPLYEPCEIAFQMTEAEAAEHANPYVSVELRAEFRSPKGGRTKLMSGFWDGGREFKIRFSPDDAEGRWDLRILSNLESVNGKTFSFQATAPRTKGFLHVFNSRYFRYDAPNTAHYWMGDTCYRVATMPWEAFRALADKRAEQKFNHLRGLALGWDDHAAKVLADPDFPKVEHFRELDRRVAYLSSKEITFDLLMAGDQNELERLLPERQQRERYVRYLAARYSAYNITWQGVQEFEEYEQGRALLKEVMAHVMRWDPYDHPRSTHTLATSSPLAGDGWMTYIVQQSSDAGLAAIDYETNLLPVVNAEFGYENSGAGASHNHHVESEAFRKRLWNAAARGLYPTFGNTGTYGGRKFEVDLKYADSPGSTYMTHLYDFFTQTRWFDLQPYYRVEGGVALSMQLTSVWDETPIGIAYVVYIEKPGPFELVVPKDGYDVSWYNPIDGTMLDEKKKFKGDRFTSAPPSNDHDWVLYLRREGKTQRMNESYFLEARRVVPKDVETIDLPFEIQFPDQQHLTAGESYQFNATLTKSTRAAKQMVWLWMGEVAGSGAAPRVLGAQQYGEFRVPATLARRFPATLSVRLLGLDGAGRLFEAFKAYTLDKPAEDAQ